MGAWTPGSGAKELFCVATWMFSCPSRAIGKTWWPISKDWPPGRVEHKTQSSTLAVPLALGSIMRGCNDKVGGDARG